jgi:hypothetical protein
MLLDRLFVILSTPELNYLLLNLKALENHLARYRMADPDFVEQVQNAAGAGRFMSEADTISIRLNDVLF